MLQNRSKGLPKKDRERIVLFQGRDLRHSPPLCLEQPHVRPSAPSHYLSNRIELLFCKFPVFSFCLPAEWFYHVPCKRCVCLVAPTVYFLLGRNSRFTCQIGPLTI